MKKLVWIIVDSLPREQFWDQYENGELRHISIPFKEKPLLQVNSAVGNLESTTHKTTLQLITGQKCNQDGAVYRVDGPQGPTWVNGLGRDVFEMGNCCGEKTVFDFFKGGYAIDLPYADGATSRSSGLTKGWNQHFLGTWDGAVRRGRVKTIQAMSERDTKLAVWRVGAFDFHSHFRPLDWRLRQKVRGLSKTDFRLIYEEAIKYDRNLDETVFCITSDHSNEWIPYSHRLNPKEFMRNYGLEGHFDFRDQGSQFLHLHHNSDVGLEEKLSELVKDEGIAFAVIPGDVVKVVYDGGSVDISFDGKRYFTEVHGFRPDFISEDDLLKFENGLTGNESFEISVDNDYPDIVERVYHAYRNPHAPDAVLINAPSYAFTKQPIRRPIGQFRSHGSPIWRVSGVPILAFGSSEFIEAPVYLDHARMEDVLPTLLTACGVNNDYEGTGRNLFLP